MTAITSKTFTYAPAFSIPRGAAAGAELFLSACRLLAFLAWVIAAAGPRLGGAQVEMKKEGIAIVIAVDISSSMLAEDFSPSNRMEVAKQQATAFIKGRSADRIGVVAFAGEALPRALGSLRDTPQIAEAVLLSTCNRTELYAVADSAQALDQWLHTQAGDLQGYLYQHADAEAVRHLFRVATGLDSMVLGEPQILGQVKDYSETAHGDFTGAWNLAGYASFFLSEGLGALALMAALAPAAAAPTPAPASSPNSRN